jgi:hypothetical protein
MKRNEVVRRSRYPAVRLRTLIVDKEVMWSIASGLEHDRQ